MHTDDDFLRKLLDNPADDTVRLVYADWLDDQDDPTAKPKSQFLRLTVKLGEPGRKPGWRKGRRKELQPLAAQLDPNWLAVVSRLRVENCAAKRASVARQFDFLCDRRWDELTPTSDGAVRFCDSCQNNVHYCDTIMAARDHAWQGHCVAVDLGIIRREGDLERPRMLMGRMRPSAVDRVRGRQQERLRPDPVSAERERRKREGKGGAND
jgi:uncharacterized protein (TIGR02996 family)